MHQPKIIVLTPVKNEAWILDRFLTVTSLFADHIIITDQDSTDGSLEIYKKYPKALIFTNESKTFNEAGRQEFLINKARELFGLNNILLAIDADEVLDAEAMDTEDWGRMLSAKPGTVLYFEKPTFHKNTDVVIRYDNDGGFPLGFVDDGTQHIPSKIHSTRIPFREHFEKIYLKDIKFLHYALTRVDAQIAKERMYSMLENVLATKPLRRRLSTYNTLKNINAITDVEKSPVKWFKKWEDKGIDMQNIQKSKYYWYDLECLRLFEKHGIERFRYENIWNVNWNEILKYYKEQEGKTFTISEIHQVSPFVSRLVIKSVMAFDSLIGSMRKIKQKFS